MSDSAPITWFTENPAPILLAGVFVLLVLGVLFLKSGRGVILMAMAGIVLFMALAVLIDHLVVTDREQVANTIYEMAAEAQRNDLNAVIDHIAPTAAEVRGDAKHWIGQAKLESVSISAMEVTLDRSKNPLQATAAFRAFAIGQLNDRGGPIPIKYIGRLTVDFHREGNRWLVTAYDHSP